MSLGLFSEVVGKYISEKLRKARLEGVARMKQQHESERGRAERSSGDIDLNKTALHELIASPNNVHWGYFSAAIQPVLTINSGEVVVIEDVPRVDPEIVERSGCSRNDYDESPYHL
jgi:hypothetical protein